ncbi:MAG: 16S rRNA (cytosine(967)-C(5))-methyltransferase RsmB [Gammaproteobacteria bacterium]
MNPRAVSARILNQVCFHGRSLSQELSQTLDNLPDKAKKQKPLIQEICYGVLRDYPRLSAIGNGLLKKPFKTKDGDVLCLLLVGLYQLIAMRVPDHAAVSETVAATKDLKKPWARALANAVLRNFLRDKGQRIKQAEQSEEACWAHPQWLIDEIRTTWPDQWEKILTANNQRPPMTLRVNLSKNSTDEYLGKLTAAELSAQASAVVTSAVQLTQPVDVALLPGFVEGRVSVQDAAAQLAAGLLQLEPGQRVLDVCAAPGGKTVHILETASVTLTAVDIEAGRLEKVQQNLDRCGQTARLIVGDAKEPKTWWDEQLYDRILLDAPCSATGVIRRHPDIKVLRRPEDINVLVELQAQILDAMWLLLRPGGMLLYATCSVLPRENHEQITAFVEKCPDALPVSIDAEWGRASGLGRQILPGENGMDGFYYACLKKQA